MGSAGSSAGAESLAAHSGLGAMTLPSVGASVAIVACALSGALQGERAGDQAGVAAACTDYGEAYRQAVNRRAREADLRMAGKAALRAEAGDAIAQRIERRQPLAAQRRRKWRGRQAEDRAVGQQMRQAAARFLAHQRRPAAFALGNHRAHDPGAGNRESKARIALGEPAL